jgi:hypothetical protein
LLELFLNWYESNRLDLEHHYSAVEFYLWPNANLVTKTGARIDFSNDHVFGRLTVWSSGECDLDVLDVETEQSLTYEYRESRDTTELKDNLDALAAKAINLARYPKDYEK